MRLSALRPGVLWLWTLFVWGQYTSEDVIKYIEKWAPVAMEEMRRTGIPASITLAQGILESGAGKSMLAVKANNHFGIKCHDWTGPRVYKDDDKKNDCFRKYKSALESYRDHSEFLRTRKRYAFLFELDPLDYKAWAHGLKKAGYATNPHYAHRLIDIIERYGLARYDTMVVMGIKYDNMSKSYSEGKDRDNLVDVSKNQSSVQWEEVSINHIKALRLYETVNWQAISEKYDIPVNRLKEYNDFLPDSIIEKAGIVFLQPKRKKSLVAERYRVQDGETVAFISQKTGIKISWLRKRNMLGECQEPLVGEWLVLRGHRTRPPRYRSCSIVEIRHVSNNKPSVSNVNESSKGEVIVDEEFLYSKRRNSHGSETLLEESNKSRIESITSEDMQVADNKATANSLGNTSKRRIHIVKQGETLYRISKMYNVTIEDLMRVNKLKSTTIYVGQRLIIPDVSRETSQ